MSIFQVLLYLLSSTPASTQPLSSLTTSASSTEPPPHIPGVSRLNIANVLSHHLGGSLRSWITSVGNETGRSWSRIGGTFRSACHPWRYAFCSFFYSCYAFENPHINHHIILLRLSPLFQGLCYHYLGLSTNKAISFIKDILFFLFSTYILERKFLLIFALLPTCMYLILAVHLKTR